MPVAFPVGSFLQATADGEAALVAAARDAVAGVDVAADLFSGLGTFALALEGRILAAEGARDAALALRAAAGRARRPVFVDHRDLYRRPLDPKDSAELIANLLGGAGLEDEALDRIRALNEIAAQRGQTLAQMALAWTLRDDRVTSTLIGASSVTQLEENVAALDRLDFTEDELAEIDRYATDAGINIWAGSSAD